MERTKKKEVSTDTENTPKVAPQFRKKGGGSLRLAGKIIKPGQIFRMWPNEIPKSFRDLVEPLDPNTNWEETEAKAKKLPKGVKTKYSVQSREGSKTEFDVVNSDHKVLNDKPLSKEVAEQFIEDLDK
jgi:hypothetical protein